MANPHAQIKIYSPVSLIVGTRGRSLGGIQGLLPGSVSRYCLQNSPVPVIVVRPEDKRKKKREKRSVLSAGSVYTSILDQTSTSGQGSSQIPNNSGGQATQGESSAVAKSIGVRPDWDGEQATERQSSVVEIGVDQAMEGLLEKSFEAYNQETPSPTGPLMMEGVDYDVPEADLGSPVLGPIGGDKSAENGEGSSRTPVVNEEEELEITKALSLEEYHAAQTKKGKGKEKLEANHGLEEDLALDLAAFQAADAARLGKEPKAKDSMDKMRADNLATIQAANKGKGKENANHL